MPGHQSYFAILPPPKVRVKRSGLSADIHNKLPAETPTYKWNNAIFIHDITKKDTTGAHHVPHESIQFYWVRRDLRKAKGDNDHFTFIYIFYPIFHTAVVASTDSSSQSAESAKKNYFYYLYDTNSIFKETHNKEKDEEMRIDWKKCKDYLLSSLVAILISCM